jgi:hypothetical protein
VPKSTRRWSTGRVCENSGKAEIVDRSANLFSKGKGFIQLTISGIVNVKHLGAAIAFILKMKSRHSASRAQFAGKNMKRGALL